MSELLLVQKRYATEIKWIFHFGHKGFAYWLSRLLLLLLFPIWGAVVVVVEVLALVRLILGLIPYVNQLYEFVIIAVEGLAYLLYRLMILPDYKRDSDAAKKMKKMLLNPDGASDAAPKQST